MARMTQAELYTLRDKQHRDKLERADVRLNRHLENKARKLRRAGELVTLFGKVMTRKERVGLLWDRQSI